MIVAQRPKLSGGPLQISFFSLEGCMGLINLRHSDNRQRFVRPLLELLEDRLQPGSLLVGQPWDIFASNQVNPDPAFADEGRTFHFRLTTADKHNGPSHAAAAILSAGG